MLPDWAARTLNHPGERGVTARDNKQFSANGPKAAFLNAAAYGRAGSPSHGQQDGEGVAHAGGYA